MNSDVKIELGVYGIVVELSYDQENEHHQGSIVSDLHEDGALEYNAAISAIESLILAHACAGIDIQSPAYLEGLETAVETCANMYDE